MFQTQRRRGEKPLKNIYHYHGKAVLAFRRTWQPHFKSNLNLFVFGYQAQLGGEKTPREHLFLSRLDTGRDCSQLNCVQQYVGVPIEPATL
jgi:hypothetical protein